ncbi:MAG: shikimate kinase [Acidobacteriota bacterium]
MDGYYDHHPLVHLDRHVAIAGLIGDETRTIGYRLAALTGLPVMDVDRSIEHTAGMSVWNLIWKETEARYRELEREHLERALTSRPLGIITLGDGTLIDEDNRRTVLESADLVSLELDLPNCYWRLKTRPTAEMDFWHPLHAGPLERFDQVKPYVERRLPGLESAPHRIQIRGKDKGVIVDELRRLVETLSAQTA